MVTQLFSMCMIHSRKLHFTFLVYFFKAYLLFLQGTEANKQNTACNLHRLPKIQSQFYIEEETSLQPFLQLRSEVSFSILRSDWDMSRVICQPSKQQKKVMELSKSDHVGLRYHKVDVVMGVKLAKRRHKGGEKGCKRVTRW